MSNTYALRRYAVVAIAATLAAACARSPGSVDAKNTADRAGGLAPARLESAPLPARDGRVVRATGIVQALEWKSVRVPQMSGVGGGGGGGFEFILTALAPNGSKVSKDDILVEFDRVNLLDQERDAVAQLENLTHQLEERKAQILSLQATRGSVIREAQADLDRAMLQLKKGPVLSQIERLKNEAKAENAKARLDSLRRSDALRVTAEEASARVLELKCDRQRVTLERIRANLQRLVIRAPQDGMVAHENTWRQGSMGPPQVGDRMWPGMPVMRVFNPARMVVQATVDEPDFATVSRAMRARVFLDAYPGEAFHARLQSASPVATAGLDSPVRNFTAVFLLEEQSPRLLPDLSAALEIERGEPGQGSTARSAIANPAGRVNP